MIKTHQDGIFSLSLKDFAHFVTDSDSRSQAQGSQESEQEEILQPGQAGEKEEFDWKTTGGTGGWWWWLGWISAGGLQ